MTDVLLQDGALSVARQLFRQLVDRNLACNLDPWDAAQGHLIRDPVGIERGSGTSLDLAALYCAMAKDAGLRPYLALGLGKQDHAFVVIDTAARAADRSAAPVWAPLALGGHVEVSEAGVVGAFDPAALAGGLPTAWIPVDPTDACRSTAAHRRSHNFEEAVAGASRHLLSDAFDRIVLIDVVAAHVNGFSELQVRPDWERPVIFSRLPSIVGYQDVPSRRRLASELSSRSGYIVLSGGPGVGKSVTAVTLASAAAGGAGWFLSADDPATLKVQLAEAAMRHLGIEAAGTEFNDIRAYSSTSFEVLQSSTARWVVVIDNANSNPKEYDRLPVPRPGQLVVITTTNRDGWDAWAAGQSLPTLMLEVPPLTMRERREWPGGESISDPPDTPLLLNLAIRLAYRNALPDGRDATALVTAGLEACSESASMAARSMSLLPSVTIDATDLDPDGEAGISVLAELSDMGLVQRMDLTSGVMHRTVRAIIRQSMADDVLDGQVLARMLRNPSSARHFATASRTRELLALAELLTRSGLPPVALGECLWALGSFQERKDPKASATLFEQALDYLPAPDSIADPRQAVMVAGCLQGIARSAFRRPSAGAEEKSAARVRLTAIQSLGDRFPEDVAVQLAVSRADAMDALLRRQLVMNIDDTYRRRVELQAALDQLERSAQRRAELVDDVTADIDRSRFNIPGTLIGLAKEGDPRQAADLLDRAEAIYQEVHAVRIRRYRTEQSEEVITCVHGLAIVNYFRALLIPALTLEDRQVLLARAVDQASEAMRVRQRLASPARLSEDSLKSASLAAKALLLMQDVGEASRVARVGAFSSLLAEATADHRRFTSQLTEESQ